MTAYVTTDKGLEDDETAVTRRWKLKKHLNGNFEFRIWLFACRYTTPMFEMEKENLILSEKNYQNTVKYLSNNYSKISIENYLIRKRYTSTEVLFHLLIYTNY